MTGALRDRDFQLLLAGQTVSYLGDQFQLIALPWLVLTLTRDPLQVGLVLGLSGTAKAIAMLIGGVLADRHSARAVMLGSDLVRCGLTGSLVLLLTLGHLNMGWIYGFSLLLGLMNGLFMPASAACVPTLLESEDLESGNALMMAADQLASFLGPAAAGMLIAASHGATPLRSVGIALGLDALSFLVSALTLAMMRPVAPVHPASTGHALEETLSGIRYVWSRPLIRWSALFSAMANVLLAGPLVVGLPVLALHQFKEGAAAFGFLMSAFALGALGGMVVAGTAPRPRPDRMAWFLMGAYGLCGIALAVLGSLSATWPAAAAVFVAGGMVGYIGVLQVTTIQRDTEEAYQGRVMSVVMLATFGLLPLSQVLSGWMVRVSSHALFLGASGGLVLTAVLVGLRRDLWARETSTCTYPAEKGMIPSSDGGMP